MKKKNIAIVAGVAGGIGAGITSFNKLKRKYKQDEEVKDKVASYYHIFNQWMRVRQSGRSLIQYFIDNGYKSIAIYGYKELGARLYDELKDSEIKVKCIIDKAADNIYEDIDAYTPDDILPKVDAIVVTAAFYFDEIENELSKKIDCPIISMEEIVQYFKF